MRTLDYPLCLGGLLPKYTAGSVRSGGCTGIDGIAVSQTGGHDFPDDGDKFIVHVGHFVHDHLSTS